MAQTLGSHSTLGKSARGLGTPRFSTWRQFFGYATQQQTADWIRQYLRSGQSPPESGRPSDWRAKLREWAERKEREEERSREPHPFLVGLPADAQDLPEALVARAQSLRKLTPRIWEMEISQRAVDQAAGQIPDRVFHNLEVKRLTKPLEEWGSGHTLLVVEEIDHPSSEQQQAIENLRPLFNTPLSGGRIGMVVLGRSPSEIRASVNAMGSMIESAREISDGEAAHVGLFGTIPEATGRTTGATAPWLLAGAAAAVFSPMLLSGSGTEDETGADNDRAGSEEGPVDGSPDGHERENASSQVEKESRGRHQSSLGGGDAVSSAHDETQNEYSSVKTFFGSAAIGLAGTLALMYGDS